MSQTIPVLGKVSYEPIKVYRNMRGGSGMPEILRWPEAATQTFKQGVPLMLSSGYLVEWDGSTEKIVGISAEPAHNLASSGVAEAGYSEAAPRNQASGKTIPPGAWMKDGKIGFYPARPDVLFSVAVENDDVFAQALMVDATFYTLEKDATTGFWFVDFDETSGDDAVVQLVENDPSAPNTTADGARVAFRFKTGATYFES